MPGPHDIGGKNFSSGELGGGNYAGPVPRREHVFAAWETRVDAMQRLLGGGNVYCIDEMRRAIESLSPKDYFSLSYYERWVRALEMLLVEKGVLTRAEIDGRLVALRPG